MDPARWRQAAIVACLANASLLVLLQTVVTPLVSAPTALFVLFTGVWLFGALMLWLWPAFGAIGTALWGVLATAAAIRTHRSFDAEDVVLVASSLAGAAIAISFAVAARRAGTL